MGAAVFIGPNIATPAIVARPHAAEWRLIGLSLYPSTIASQSIRTLSVQGGSDARLGGCTTPDPFLAFGGSVCYDAGWLPPGVPAPGTSITYVGACATPDPFVSLGGGRCVNGGWLPPSPPTPSPTPTPVPTPTPTPGGCTTPDPFVALGGGTCVNGGWTPGRAPLLACPKSFAARGSFARGHRSSYHMLTMSIFT